MSTRSNQRHKQEEEEYWSSVKKIHNLHGEVTRDLDAAVFPGQERPCWRPGSIPEGRFSAESLPGEGLLLCFEGLLCWCGESPFTCLQGTCCLTVTAVFLMLFTSQAAPAGGPASDPSLLLPTRTRGWTKLRPPGLWPTNVTLFAVVYNGPFPGCPLSQRPPASDPAQSSLLSASPQ